MKKATGLGKGLSALISERKIDISEVAESAGKKSEINIEELFPSRFQPRTIFDKTELEELSESIRKKGVLQPILVRKRRGQGYEIIAGERRWRASKMAKTKTIPAVILDVDDKQAMEIALVENVQRQNLKVLEEAEGYKRLISEFEYTQEQLADVVGKSRSHITNIMRLLGLPDGVKEHLNNGKISSGHARALLSAPKPEAAVKEVIGKRYSVRQTENFVKKLLNSNGSPVLRRKYNRKKKNDITEAIDSNDNIADLTQTDENLQQAHNESENTDIKQIEENKQKEPEILMMEKEISEKSGFDIEINNNDESGELVVKYNSMEELNLVMDRLENKNSFLGNVYEAAIKDE